MATPPYPLNCYSGLASDDFAGWYAVSNRNKCQDFCYWQQPESYYDRSGANNMNNNTSYTYTYSIADPHQTTITKEGAKWICLLQTVDDSINWQNVFERPSTSSSSSTNIINYYDDLKIEKFPYLRCARGVNEELKSIGQDMMRSVTFWSIVMCISFASLIFQFVYFVRRKRKRLREIECHEIIHCHSNELLMALDDDDDDEEKTEEEDDADMQQQHKDDLHKSSLATTHDRENNVHGKEEKRMEQQEVLLNVASNAIIPETVNMMSNTNNHLQEQVRVQAQAQPHTKYQKIKSGCSKHICTPTVWKYTRIIFLLSLDLFTLYVIFTSILVLTEIDQNLTLSHSLQMLTPPCTDTNLICPKANNPMNKPSISRTDAIQGFKKPFSYIIASDSQIDWYNGESADIGSTNIPKPCSEYDTCGTCTQKLGEYSNSQMKRSFEVLMQNGRSDSDNDGDGGASSNNTLPIPKTLVMNGDLTQYFHRHERLKYESYYHNLKGGIEQYFPSLGNHDYDQYSGATYDNDEWVGPHHCNGKHAVSYFKGAFCNSIPHFYAQERLTRYDPKSLSYSWEEGPYHFVQVHYHPNYESAALGIASSVEWLTNDLIMANEKNLTTVLFIHASHWLSNYLEHVLLDNNVAVIFTGHLHRCFGPKCEKVVALNTNQAEKYYSGSSEVLKKYERVEKCYPASAALCSTRANGNGLYYVNDISPDLTLPERKLVSRVPQPQGLCPVGKYGPFLNKTDNTSLCRRQSITPHFPFREIIGNDKKIPIFWSGSASFETFLVADFYLDRIVVNMMTATEGNEGKRYIDVKEVPNAIYPFHNTTDLDEHVIYIL